LCTIYFLIAGLFIAILPGGAPQSGFQIRLRDRFAPMANKFCNIDFVENLWFPARCQQRGEIRRDKFSTIENFVHIRVAFSIQPDFIEIRKGKGRMGLLVKIKDDHRAGSRSHRPFWQRGYL